MGWDAAVQSYTLARSRVAASQRRRRTIEPRVWDALPHAWPAGLPCWVAGRLLGPPSSRGSLCLSLLVRRQSSKLNTR